MNSILSILAFITFAAAVPNYDQAWDAQKNYDPAWDAQQKYDPAWDAQQGAIVSQGPWVEDAAWERDPKGIMNMLPKPTSILAKLGNWWTWDREVVKKGIFENENIMIHVGQNLFNFVFTTLAWFTISQIYSLSAKATAPSVPATGRQQRAITITEAADEVLAAIRSFEHKY